MPLSGYLIGIDFGTSNTVGVLRYPDGRSESLLFDGSPMLLSGVCLDENGQFLTGRDAAHVARTRPEAFEPNPKRRIDDGTVLLGRREVPVPQLLAAVLSRVMTEARRATGRRPEQVVLTHPVAWGPRRLDVLRQAAASAGIPSALLVPEPVAAAYNFVAQPRASVAPGQSMVVYDFGGGTFDATVVRRSPAGFDVTAYQGLDDVGGLDIDAAIVEHLGSTLGFRGAEIWERLKLPTTAPDRRAARLLWEDVRQAKETLSRTSTVHIHVPLLDDDLPLGREQLEALARPLLNQTVGTSLEAIRAAATPPGGIAAVLLVGGSSRIPLAATLLHQQIGLAPTVVENPELVVAQGAILVGAAAPAVPPGAPVSPPGVGAGAGSPAGPVPGAHSPAAGPSAPVPGAPVPGVVLPPPRKWGPGRTVAVIAAAVAVVLVLCAGIALRGLFAAEEDQGSGNGDDAAAAPSCPAELAFIGALTGDGAALGRRVSNGIQLAVSQYNDESVDCDVTLGTYDTGGDEAEAGQLATAIAEDVATVGVIGPLRPGELDTAGKIYDESGLPMITPVGDANALAQWKTFHQVIGDEDAPNLVARSYLLDTLKATKVYVADDGSDHGRKLAGYIRGGLEEERASAGSESIPEDPATIGDVVGRIRESGASAVMYVGAAAPAGRLRKALTEGGAAEVTLVGTSEIDDPAFFREAGDTGQGTVLFGQYLPTKDIPAEFRTAYRARFGEDPGRYSAEAYDAATVFLDGIDADSRNRKQMLDFVDGYDADGVTKHLKFNELGDLATPTMWLYEAGKNAFTSTGKLTP